MKEQPTACEQAFVITLAENRKNTVLTGNYRLPMDYEDMIEAVAFWRTIQERMDYEDRAELNEVIRSHSGVGRGNIYIYVAAKLELLPARVFRRVLWFYNIDYQSLESCLRRLTSEQIAGILETYDDLFGLEPKVPRCFTEGAYGVVRQLIPSRKVTIKELLLYDRGDAFRYETKGALAFNFFGWDLGYCKYPKEESDEMLADNFDDQMKEIWSSDAEKKFTTNKGEGGIYAFLHRTCRSNYAWRTGRAVAFDAKVCPEVRHTIMAWFIFLFLSPAAFALLWSMPISDMEWYHFLGVAVGFVTPGILLFAALKFIMLRICDLINLAFSWIEDHFESVHIDRAYWEEVGEVLCVWAVMVICTAMFVAAWWGLSLFLGNIFSATVVTVFVFFYALHMIHYKKWILPTEIPVAGKPAVCFALAMALYVHHIKVFEFALGCFSWAASHLPIVLFALLSFGLAWSWRWFGAKIDQCAEYLSASPDAEKRVEIIYNRAMTVTYVLIGGVFLTVLWFWWSFFGFAFIPYFSAFIIIIFVAGVFGGAMFLTEPRSAVNEQRIIKAVSRSGAPTKYCFYRTMKENAWLLSDEDPLPKLEKIWCFVGRFVSDKAWERFVFMNGKGFALLDEYGEFFSTHSNFNREDYFGYLIDGVPLEKAKKAIGSKGSYLRHIEKAFDWCGDWVLALSGPFVKIWKVLRGWTESAYVLWKDFSVKCPFDTLPKRIK
jgi:hypothetical protein